MKKNVLISMRFSLCLPLAADLFPRCSHVESIVCLSKLADDHIEL